MKKIILLFLVFAYYQSFAQQVDYNIAKKVAENYYNYVYALDDSSGLKASKFKKVNKSFPSKHNGRISYYVMNMDNGGWVIVSSHKAIGPILAHSDKGEINEGSVPQVFIDWMKQYERSIDYAYSKNLKKKDKEKKWKDIEEGIVTDTQISNESNLKSTTTTNGFYLLDTKWGQTETNDYACPASGSYNAWMPQNCSSNCGGRAAAGCVAVAIAQIMNYWKFATGDYADFEWWNMPNELKYYGNPDYEIQKNAVSYLLKRVGDRVDMDYGCSSSADTYDKGIYAFKAFGYVEGDMDYERCYTHTYNAWVDDLKNELNNGRPVLYRYVGQHSFVCDGYQNEHSFHFNLGWNGYCDGFYDYEDLYVGGVDFTNTNNHATIIGIRPNNRTTWNLQNVSISTTTADQWPKKITYEANNIVASGGTTYFEVNQNADCHLIGYQSVKLETGFKAKQGCTFLAHSSPSTSIKSAFAFISDENINNDLDEKANALNEDEISKCFNIYPNPAKDFINVLVKKNTSENINIDIYNSTGIKVRNINYNSLNERIDISDLSIGMYYLKIGYGNKVYNFKFIKK